MGIFCQDSPCVTRLGWLPCRASFPHLERREPQVNLMRFSVDRDRIAISYQRDGSSDIGLGCDVADNKSVTTAREPPVGDEGDLSTESLSHDAGSRGKHLS